MIITKPPTSIDVEGLSYEIDADFRTMIEIEHLLMDKEVTEEQKFFAKEIMDYDGSITFEQACKNAKYYEALKLFFKRSIPGNLQESMEKLVWFYGCGKTDINQHGKKDKKQLYSYKYDFDYINAGFLQDYKMDLFDTDFLHWWKFVSLFSALKDDCKIREIMGYRGADLKDLDKEDRKRVKEMQGAYALPKNEMTKEEEELEKKIRDALINGGNVDEILKSE